MPKGPQTITDADLNPIEKAAIKVVIAYLGADLASGSLDRLPTPNYNRLTIALKRLVTAFRKHDPNFNKRDLRCQL